MIQERRIMAQIVLAEDGNAPLGPLRLNLKTYTGAEIVPRHSAEEVIELLKLLPEIEVVISVDFIEQENTAEILLKHFREYSPQATLLIFGQAPPHDKNEIIHIEDKDQWEQVVRVTGRILGIDITALDQEIKTRICCHPTSLFSLYRQYPLRCFYQDQREC